MDVVELHEDDWEVLPDSDNTTSLIQTTTTTSYLEGIEGDSEGIIRSDYFSLDSRNKYALIEDGVSSVESDNPSWIDPVSDNNTRYSRTKAEFWSSDGGSSSDDGKFIESEANNNDIAVDSGEIESEPRKFEEIDHVEESEDNSGEDEEKIVENEGVLAMKSDDGEERNNRVAVWWKLPLDLLKYCLFRASPVWTISMAAAMMGVVILGRRLYKMKRKSTSLQLKVTVDDKKVSQFMTRAARLNEAFSVVKRGPMIRPSLPAAGIAPWPMMALR